MCTDDRTCYIQRLTKWLNNCLNLLLQHLVDVWVEFGWGWNQQVFKFSFLANTPACAVPGLVSKRWGHSLYDYFCHKQLQQRERLQVCAAILMWTVNTPRSGTAAMSPRLPVCVWLCLNCTIGTPSSQNVYRHHEWACHILGGEVRQEGGGDSDCQDGEKEFTVVFWENQMFDFWAPTEFRETLKSSIRKQVAEEMAEAGFTPTPDQIMNKLKKNWRMITETAKETLCCHCVYFKSKLDVLFCTFSGVLSHEWIKKIIQLYN